MMTVEQAKELCIKAHEGQWRKPRELKTGDFSQELSNLPSYGEHILTNGKKAIWNTAFAGRWTIAEPYSSHPIAVAEMMTTNDEKIVAYLHDVIEDCEGWDLNTNIANTHFWLIAPDGTEFELTQDVYYALKALTKTKDMAYTDYIKAMTDSNKLATKVKIADMFHNMSDNPSEKQKRKYLEGIKYLLTTI